MDITTANIETLKAEIAGLRSEIERYRERERDLEDSRRAMLYMLEDINETTADLERARDEWEDTFNAISEPVMLLDADFRIVKANRVTSEKLGIGQPEVQGMTCYKIFHGLESPHPSCPYAELMKDGLPHMAEIYEERLGGYYLITVSPIKDADGKLRGAIHFGKNITERKQAEEALRQSEKRYRHLIESVTDYIYSVQVEDGSPGKTLHGEGCLAVTGYTAGEYNAEPDLWYRMIFDEDRKAVTGQVARVLSGEAVPHIEHRIVRKDGAIRWVKNRLVARYDEKGSLVAYDGLISDITDRKKLEEQLRHAQKMEAVGTLAGGIAHDFNNLLNVIMGYGNLVKDNLEPGSPSKEHMTEVLAAAEKAVSLTRRLLAFSRKQAVEVRPVDIDDLILGLRKLLVRLIGEDIEFNLDLADRPLVVMADAGQIEQVLINLATNARDALPNGGRFTVGARLQELDDGYVVVNGFARPGRYALITCADTGHGMDAETQRKIFEPFFTTKGIGQGTGLGLAISYGIIQQHGGYIKVDSEPDKGTVFRIYLPLLEETASTLRKPQPDAAVHGGNETILVAEDEASLRKLTKIVLEAVGYSVITAEDGEDAIAKFMENKDRIALAVLDIIMPKKGGKEVSEVMRVEKPGIRILFASGYTRGTIKTRGVMESGFDFIQKPVASTDLLRTVREILDR